MKKSIFISAMLCPFLILGELHAQNDATDDDWENNSGDIITESGFTGNVGIGVVSPGFLLDVNGEINMSEENRFHVDGVPVFYVNTGDADNEFSTSFGWQASHDQTGGVENSYFGYQSGGSSNTGSENSFFGAFSGSSNTSGGGNTFIGFQSGMENTSASLNTFLGWGAGLRHGTGDRNTFIGHAAGQRDTTGDDNVFIGALAAQQLDNGDNNVIIGVEAGRSSDGTGNIMIGRRAGWGLITSNTGSANVFIGTSSAYNNSSGSTNTFLGNSSGYFNQTGSNNSFVGASAGYRNQDGDYNTCLGVGSGDDNVSGTYNTFLGYEANRNMTDLDYATAIGAQAIVDCDDCMVLGRTSGNGTNVGIGVTAPGSRLHVDATGDAITFEGVTGVTGSYNMLVIKDDVLYTTPGVNNDADWYEIGTTTPPDAISDDMYTEGFVRIGEYQGASGNMEVYSSDGTAIVGYNDGAAVSIGGFFGGYNGSDISIGAFGHASGGPYENVGVRGEVEPGNDFATNYGVQGIVEGQDSTDNHYAIYGTTSTTPYYWAGYFDGRVHTTSYYTAASDRKLKKEIKDIPDATALLDRLEPKSYYFRRDEFPSMTLNDQKSYGLIAQEVEEVLPEVITPVTQPAKYGKDGELIHEAVKYKGINYDAFIPILIQGFKEQQAYIESLEERIEKLEVADNNIIPAGKGEENKSGENVLLQNTPNPFTEQTTIAYVLMENVQQAQLLIFNMQGTQLSSYELNDRGRGNLVLNGGDLQAGMYLYSLIADGEEVDTKRMILTK